MRRTLVTLFTLALGAAPLAAQTSPVPKVGTPATSAEASAKQRYESSLPARTLQLQGAGLHDTTIHRLIETLRERDLTPAQSDRVLVATRDAARTYGPTDNFGAFVQSQLDAGKRGRALASAIRAEHRAHGQGNARARARKAERERVQERNRDRARDNEHPTTAPETPRRP